MCHTHLALFLCGKRTRLHIVCQTQAHSSFHRIDLICRYGTTPHVLLRRYKTNLTNTLLKTNTKGQTLVPKVASSARNDTATWNGVAVGYQHCFERNIHRCQPLSWHLFLILRLVTSE